MDFANMPTSDIEQLMLQTAAAEQQRLSTPDDSTKWAMLAQAMGSPTRTGSFGEALGTTAGALGEYNKYEGQRKTSAADEMQKALGMAYKIRSDLEEQKQRAISSTKSDYQIVNSDNGGVWRVSKEPGVAPEMLVPGSLHMKQYQQVYEVNRKRLEGVGGMDAETMDELARRQTLKELSARFGAMDMPDVPTVAPTIQGAQPAVPQQPSIIKVAPGDSLQKIAKNNNVPIYDLLKANPQYAQNPGAVKVGAPIRIPTPTPATAPVPAAQPTDDSNFTSLPLAGNEEAYVAKRKAQGATDKQIADEMTAKFGGQMDAAAQVPEINKQAPAPSSSAPHNLPEVMIKTPQQTKIDEENAKRDAEYIAGQRTALDAYRPMVDSLNRMEQLTMQGTTQGPLSDVISKVGGVVNYFDPEDSLAKLSGNDNAYFSSLQNLVRDKIKSLGAGTAISNLDLIVTQSSLGGLLTTKQGRMKILGALKADMESARLSQEAKISHYEATGELKGYRPSTVPLVGVIAKPQIMPNGETLTTYVPIAKDKWIDAARKYNPKATEQTLTDEWVKFVKSFGGTK